MMVICSLLNAFGLFCLKKSSFSFEPASLINNYWLFLGFALYFSGAVVMLLAFRRGEVSMLYPVMASTYIWIALISMLLLKERISLAEWGGISSIVAGIVIIGASQEDKAGNKGAGVP